MENTNEGAEDVIEDVDDIVETKDDDGNDTTDYKAEASKYKDQALKNQGIAKRYKTKFEKAKDKPTEAKPKEGKTKEPDSKKDVENVDKKPSDLDYGQKAYLKSSGIEESEIEFVKKVMDDTGKTIEEVLASKYFQAELKEKREVDRTEEAKPKGSGKSGSPARSTPEYWIAKGEMPPNTPENQKLRIEIVNLKQKNDSSGSNFTESPVAGNYSSTAK